MVRHVDEIGAVTMTGEDVRGVTKRICLGPKDGYPGFFRVFTVETGGHTPYHSHEWWHANYILEGEGKIIIEGVEQEVRAGSVAYIESGKVHRFVNSGTGPLRFVCLVPEAGDKY